MNAGYEHVVQQRLTWWAHQRGCLDEDVIGQEDRIRSGKNDHKGRITVSMLTDKSGKSTESDFGLVIVYDSINCLVYEMSQNCAKYHFSKS